MNLQLNKKNQSGAVLAASDLGYIGSAITLLGAVAFDNTNLTADFAAIEAIAEA